MGGKEGAVPPSPSPTSSSVVCCMCGDHGLPQELFRCKICLVRSQHKYCSDLYLKTETYRACNWCLRDEGVKSLPQESSTQDHNNSTSSSSGSNNGGLGLKVHRGAYALHLNKPIKKQRAPERSPTVEIARSAELSPGLGRSKHAFRGKVRRYKLLEEVSSQMYQRE
ncbi:uncharacterized protein LOC103723726 [Phoenix dactylifera]|uniref:Uncharacterized protein LOC103723726 n=1 Tax=Phoenix dactylifera TaxID=42345 RepID=A0A8B7D4E1_PHODC|nr:uncharacterized protein LOC103723726 [Phoenix dactylifera]